MIKESWAKGGRRREIAVRTDGQRQVLREARQLAGSGAMIAPGRNYRMQRDAYEAGVPGGRVRQDARPTARVCSAPVRGDDGVAVPGAWRSLRGRTLRGSEREADRRARLAVSEELGHGRIEVAAQYLGS